MRRLFLRGAHPAPDHSGASLHEAAMRGDALSVRRWLQRDPAAVDQRDAEGATPLYRAVEHGRLPVVSLLLSFKADVTATVRGAETPLSAAQRHFDADVGHIMYALMLLSGVTDLAPRRLQELVDVVARISTKGRMAFAVACLDAVCQRYAFADTEIAALMAHDRTFNAIRTYEDWEAWYEGRPEIADQMAALFDRSARAAFAALQADASGIAFIRLLREGRLTPPLTVLLLDEALAEIGQDRIDGGAEQETLDVVMRVVACLYTLRVPLPDFAPYVRSRFTPTGWGTPVPGAGPMTPPSDDDYRLRLHSGTPDERSRAAEALGRRRNRSAVPALLIALHDAVPAVRASAAVALEAIGDAKAVAPLIATLADDAPVVRQAAATALGRLRDRRAVVPLLDRLTDPQEETEVREAAIGALGDLGDRRAVPALIDALRDGTGMVRASAIAALSKLCDATAVEPLLSLLQAADRETRLSAIEVLGHCHDPRAVEPLLAVLDDPEWVARELAADALGRLGDPRALARLEWVQRHDTGEGSGYVREAATRAIAQIMEQNAR